MASVVGQNDDGSWQVDLGDGNAPIGMADSDLPDSLRSTIPSSDASGGPGMVSGGSDEGASPAEAPGLKQYDRFGNQYIAPEPAEPVKSLSDVSNDIRNATGANKVMAQYDSQGHVVAPGVDAQTGKEIIGTDQQGKPIFQATPAPQAQAAQAAAPSAQNPAPPQAGTRITSYQPQTQPSIQPPQLQQYPKLTTGGGGGGKPNAEIQTIQNASDAEAKAKEQEGLVLQNAGVAKEAALNNQAVYDQHRAKSKDLMVKAIQDKQDAMMNDYAKKIDDFNNGKIDPDRAWKNKNTFQKIMAIAGSAIGGFTNGYTQGRVQNSALEMLKESVRNDIQAQVQDRENQFRALGASKNLVDMAHESGIEKQHQYDIATAAGDNIAAKQIEAMGAGFTGQQQQQAALGLANGLKAEGAQKIAQVRQAQNADNRGWAELHLRTHEAQVADVERQNQMAIAQQQRQLLGQLAGGGTEGGGGGGVNDATANYLRAQGNDKIAHLGANENVAVDSPKTKEDLENTLGQISEVQPKIDRLLQLREKHNGGELGGPWSSDREEASQLGKDIKVGLAGLSGYSRLSPELIKLTGENVPEQPLGIFQPHTEESLRAIKKSLEAARKGVRAKYGLSNPDTGFQEGK